MFGCLFVVFHLISGIVDLLSGLLLIDRLDGLDGVLVLRG